MRAANTSMITVSFFNDEKHFYTFCLKVPAFKVISFKFKSIQLASKYFLILRKTVEANIDLKIKI